MIVFICGKCSKRLQVADDYAGKKCRCPACSSINNVPTGQPRSNSAAPPSSLGEILGNSSNSNSYSGNQQNSGNYWSNVESSSGQQPQQSNPYAAPSYQSQPQLAYAPNPGYGIPDANPLGLIFGILSLCMPLLVCFTYGIASLLGLVMGIVAWVASAGERRKAAQGLVRRGIADVGYVLGIIGTIINAILILFFAAIIIFVAIAAANGGLPNQR